MKNIYNVNCDYCGNRFKVRMHAAEFKRCTGKAVCERRDCRDKNTAEIQAKIAQDIKKQPTQFFPVPVLIILAERQQ